MDTVRIPGRKSSLGADISASTPELTALAYEAVAEEGGWTRFLQALHAKASARALTFVFRDGVDAIYASTTSPLRGFSATIPPTVFRDRSISRKGFLAAHARSSTGAGTGDLFEHWEALREHVREAEDGSSLELFGSRDQEWRKDERTLLAGLLPHVHRAVRVDRRASRQRFRQTALEEVVSALHLGVILLGPESEVRYVNPAAERMVERTPRLAVRDGRLWTTPASTASELFRKVKRAALAPARGEEMSSCIRLGESDASILLWLRPLLPDLAWIAVTAPTRTPASPPETLQRAFGLTPTESEVTRLFAQSWTPEQIAAHLGMSPETARVHIKRVLAKTDTHRQVELFRRIVDCIPEIVSEGDLPHPG